MEPSRTEDEWRQLVADAYTDRNLLAQLVAWVAVRHGWSACWMEDAAEPEWPVLAIELPTGQITYHIPRSEAIYQGELPVVENRWDGHSTEEKRERIRHLVDAGPGEIS